LNFREKLINKQIVKTVGFDKLPPYPVRSFTYRNEQVRADEVLTVIVYILYMHYIYRYTHTHFYVRTEDVF
jgi:hypothetical protein